jgi:hypothetical protein
VYNVETGVSWRKLKIGCSSFCLLFGAILIAIAAFVPSVVNNSISNGVQDTARLDPEKMTDSQMAKFVNGTTNEAFYLFTITNLADVLNNGAKINYKEIGPINTKRHGYRYNITVS